MAYTKTNSGNQIFILFDSSHSPSDSSKIEASFSYEEESHESSLNNIKLELGKLTCYEWHIYS